MRRILLLSVVLLACLAEARASQSREDGAHPRSLAEARASQSRDPRSLAEARVDQAREGGQPPPVFRGGTTLVQVDAIVSGPDRRPIVDLAPADFELLDDGKPAPIDRVRFLGAADYAGDATLAPIRTHEDEEREASRDDVRVYAIVLDDYHVDRMGELRVIEPLLAFVRQLPETDLVAVYYPLDSVTDVAFTRDRTRVANAIRAFAGRKGDYQPKHPVEEEHLRHPREIERIRREIVATALEGLATHLGAIKQGRKSIIFVSEGYTQPAADVRDLYEAANRSNVAVYPLDPRGLTTDRSVDRGSTAEEIMAQVLPPREFMRTLAMETGGRAIVQNDLRAGLGEVIRDSRAYYLIAYESPHADDGKFHKVTVRVKRRGATVFARTGYWASKRGDKAVSSAASLAEVPPAVQRAVNGLAESLRPDADEPPEGRRRIVMPGSEGAPGGLNADPTMAVVHGTAVSGPVVRREFRRADTVVVRAGMLTETPAAGRLLDRRGQLLTELPLTAGLNPPEVRLALGSLGPGDYVIELAQQYVAFRVVR